MLEVDGHWRYFVVGALSFVYSFVKPTHVAGVMLYFGRIISEIKLIRLIKQDRLTDPSADLSAGNGTATGQHRELIITDKIRDQGRCLSAPTVRQANTLRCQR